LVKGSTSDEGGILQLGPGSAARPNPCTPREGADLCPAQLQLLFGATVATARASCLPDFTAQGWGRGELISDYSHQVASLPP